MTTVSKIAATAASGALGLMMWGARGFVTTSSSIAAPSAVSGSGPIRSAALRELRPAPRSSRTLQPRGLFRHFAQAGTNPLQPLLAPTGRLTDALGLFRHATAALHDLLVPSLGAAPTPGPAFEGIGNGFSGPSGTFAVNSAPPFANGDVGPNHYVQVVNTDFAVFNKTGIPLYGPVPINTLWSGFGGDCQTNNDGDPLVLYDPIADRWVISQFSVTGADGTTKPFLECVAVSVTPDPTGAYNRYAFNYTGFPDAPKMGVWPDAYYTTFNIFNAAGTAFLGAKICAYDRTKMLAGQAATQQCFDTGTSFSGILPADLDGTTQPPAGSPNYVVGLGPTTNGLAAWKFHVDFTTPSNSTLTGPTTVPVPGYLLACGGRTCIPQAGTAQQLDSLGDRLMYRLAYRNFGDHEALVVNHSVQAGLSTGVRWYELRVANQALSLFQSGTYAPDSSHRWMGSVAQDRAGNMALGFSRSSSSLNPQIHYTGRLAGDVLGTLTQGESIIIDGGGSQGSGLSRWGDYSMMAVDPTDDCTFWYTNEYLATSGTFNWSTRIASFRLPGCPPPPPPDFALSVAPASATVNAGAAANYTTNIARLNGFAGAVAFSVSGLPAGVSAAFTPNPASGTSAALAVSTSSTTPAGSYVFTVTGTSAALTHSTSATLVVTAQKALATVTLGNLSAIYDGTAHAATATTSPSPLTVTFTYDGGATPPTAAGSYTVVATITDANYEGSVTGTLTIAKADQTITVTGAAPANAAYNTTFRVTATASSTLAVAITGSGGCSGSGTGSATITITSGTTTCAVSYSQAGNNNYHAALASTSFTTAQKASATVTLGNLSAIYDGATHAATATTSPSVATVSVTYNGGAPVPTAAGSYTVVATITDANYEGSATGTLTIAKADQTITVTGAAPASAAYNTTFLVTATASSTLGVAITASGGCSGSGTGSATITMTSGTTACVVNYTQAGSANYHAAPPVTSPTTAQKATATVTLSNLTQTYDGTPKSAAAATTPVGLSVSLTYDGSTTAPTNAGTYAVSATVSDLNYSGSITGTLTLNKAGQTTVTVSASSDATYGQAGSLATASGGSGTGAYRFSAAGSTACAVNGGTGAIAVTSPAGTCRITAVRAGDANYTVSAPSASATVTIHHLPPIVTPDLTSTLESVAVTIPVLANDSSPIGAVLSIQSVGAPGHGTAVINGTQVTYTPALNFFGTDTFLYTASDGLGGFSSTTVTVTVSRAGRFVAFSMDRTVLGDSTQVFTGDVGANRAHADTNDDHGGGRDRDDTTVWLEKSVTMRQSTSRVVGDTVRLDQQASIYNLVDNQTINHHATVLSTTSVVTLPFMAMPAFPTGITAGTQDVTVARGATVTLGSGQYRRVRVKNGGTLKLSGGLYQVLALDVGGDADHAEGDQESDHDDGGDEVQTHATVIVQATTEIRVQGLMDTHARAQLLLDAAVAGLRADQVVIYVAGTTVDREGDHRNGEHRDAPHADIGAQNTIQANIYAPNGTLRLGSLTKAIGAFVAKQVTVGEHVELTLASAFR